MRSAVLKPSLKRRRRDSAARRGAGWNTVVRVAKVATLVDAGYQHVPAMSVRLGHIEPFEGTEEETWAMQHAYALMPTANFSHAVIEACPPYLAVSSLP